MTTRDASGNQLGELNLRVKTHERKNFKNTVKLKCASKDVALKIKSFLQFFN